SPGLTGQRPRRRGAKHVRSARSAMNTAKAQREILSRLRGSDTILCAILLHLDVVPEWTDGTAGGRAAVLVGRKNLGTSPEATTVVDHVLTALAAGNVPSGVLPIIYQPCASAAIAAIVSAEGGGEILLDGPRGSG